MSGTECINTDGVCKVCGIEVRRGKGELCRKHEADEQNRTHMLRRVMLEREVLRVARDSMKQKWQQTCDMNTKAVSSAVTLARSERLSELSHARKSTKLSHHE